jgi:hypothetical protein
MMRAHLHIFTLGLMLAMTSLADPPASATTIASHSVSSPDRKVPDPNYVCLPSYSKLSVRGQNALQIEREQRVYVDGIMAQQHVQSDALANEIERANALGNPFVVDVVGVGAGPQNAIAFANLRAELPNGVFVILETSDRLGTFDKMRSFDVNTKELGLASGNTFPGVPVQPRDLNPHGVKYLPSTNFADVTALAHHYSRVKVLFEHSQIGLEEEPAPGAWPARYRVKIRRVDKFGNSKDLFVYSRAEIAAPGFGEPESRVSDQASQDLIAEEAAQTATAMAHPTSRLGHAPGIQTVDSMLRIAGDDAKEGRSPMARYGDGDFVVVGPRDGGAIGVEAITGLNATLNPGGVPTHNPVTWLGQKAKTGAAYRDSIPNRARVDRYERIGAKIDSKQVTTQAGYLQKVEPVLENGKRRFLITYSEHADGSGAQGTLTTAHLVFATGYQNGVMKLFDGLGGPEAPPALRPIVQNPQLFTSNPSFHSDTTIASQVVTQKSGGSERPHQIYVVGNAILNTQGGGEISSRESGGAVGGFIDILGPRSATAGRRMGEELRGGLTPIPLQRLEIAPENHPPDYFDRQYLVSEKTTQPSPFLFQNRSATELEMKIRLARFFSRFRLPQGKDPIDFQITRESGRISLRIYGLSAGSSDMVASEFNGDRKLIQLLDNLFEQGGKSVNVTTTVRGTGSIEPENMVFQVD